MCSMPLQVRFSHQRPRANGGRFIIAQMARSKNDASCRPATRTAALPVLPAHGPWMPPLAAGAGWEDPGTAHVCPTKPGCKTTKHQKAADLVGKRQLFSRQSTEYAPLQVPAARALASDGQQPPKTICLQLLAAWPLLLQLPHQLLLRLLSLLSLAFGLPAPEIVSG